MSERTQAPYRLLLVEDNPADMRLMEEAIRHGGLGGIATTTACYSAEDCMTRLQEAAGHHSPYQLVILDLNMPRTTGKELLRMIRADRRYRRIPLFVFTNSDSPRDLRECMELGADLYVQKPADFSVQVEFFEVIRESLVRYHRIDVDMISARFGTGRRANGH